MAAAFSNMRDGCTTFPAAAMLALAAAAAATARDDGCGVQPALADSSFFAGLSFHGSVSQLELVLELDAQSGSIVFSSQFGAERSRTAQLRSSIISSATVSLQPNVVYSWIFLA